MRIKPSMLCSCVDGWSALERVIRPTCPCWQYRNTETAYSLRYSDRTTIVRLIDCASTMARAPNRMQKCGEWWVADWPQPNGNRSILYRPARLHHNFFSRHRPAHSYQWAPRPNAPIHVCEPAGPIICMTNCWWWLIIRVDGGLDSDDRVCRIVLVMWMRSVSVVAFMLQHLWSCNWWQLAETVTILKGRPS